MVKNLACVKIITKNPIAWWKPLLAPGAAGVGSVDTSGKGGIIDKFSTGRRRLKENIAQKTGKEAADNSEFAERAQRVTDLREKVSGVWCRYRWHVLFCF